MKTLLKIFLALLFVLSFKAQNLIDGAESVAYHAETNSYFVSSLMRLIRREYLENGSFINN